MHYVQFFCNIDNNPLPFSHGDCLFFLLQVVAVADDPGNARSLAYSPETLSDSPVSVNFQ